MLVGAELPACLRTMASSQPWCPLILRSEPLLLPLSFFPHWIFSGGLLGGERVLPGLLSGHGRRASSCGQHKGSMYARVYVYKFPQDGQAPRVNGVQQPEEVMHVSLYANAVRNILMCGCAQCLAWSQSRAW